MVEMLLSQEMMWSLFTGLSTVVGALLMFLIRFNNKTMAFILGGSAGVLVMISLFILFPTAYALGSIWHHTLGLSLALLLMVLLHQYSSSKVEENGDNQTGWLRLGFFLVVAIAAHNIPEGAAIGISFHAEHHPGYLLVFALMVHNIPEGMGLATPFLAAKKGCLPVLGWSLFCAMTLPLGTLLGLKYFVEIPGSIPVGFVFAGTIMIWIVVMEIFPRAKTLHRLRSWYGFILGLIFMYTVHLFH